MPDTNAHRIATLMRNGAFAQALPLLEQALADAELAVAPTRSDILIAMVSWQGLVEQYAPARAALGRIRDAQARLLLGGQAHVGQNGNAGGEEFGRIGRFSLIVDINEMLGDAASTCDIFMELRAEHPALARQAASSALPALVEAGQFSVADHYRDDPLAWLEDVNRTALTSTLRPPPRQAPRLAAKLNNLVRDVRIAGSVLRGLGEDARADALVDALLSGLADDELKATARRELADPGTIMRELVAHQMAQESEHRGQV